MLYCDFQRINEEQVKCSRCGRLVKTKSERVVAMCRGAGATFPKPKPLPKPCNCRPLTKTGKPS